MNAKQWTIISVSITLVILSELFPPWVYVSPSNRCPAGYSFITRPPVIRSYEDMRNLCFNSDVSSPEFFRSHRDEDGLNWHRAITGILCCGLVLLLTGSKSSLKKLCGGLVFVTGLLMLAAYVFIYSHIYYR